MLAALLGASAAHAAAPCVEPPAEAGFPPVTLQQVAQGLRDPVHVAVVPDGNDRLYVVEQVGVVRVVEWGQVRPEPFLDIRGQVESGGEKGLLSIAFHPRYQNNGSFFVGYTARDATGLHTRISRWRRASAERADPKAKQCCCTSVSRSAITTAASLPSVRMKIGSCILIDHCVGKILKIMPKP